LKVGKATNNLNTKHNKCTQYLHRYNYDFNSLRIGYFKYLRWLLEIMDLFDNRYAILQSEPIFNKLQK